MLPRKTFDLLKPLTTHFCFLSLDVRLVKRRVHNPFAVIISDLMSETEALMRTIYSVGKAL